MIKVKPKTTSESGITLIALLVMIVLLVILSAVAIQGLGGNHGLIESSQVAAEDYKITAQKESLEQTIRAEMIAKGTIRKNSNTRRNSRNN